MAENINTVNSYLSFKLGNEYFAAHVNNVINILELTDITPVPRSPSYMKGVINLRGTVLPVVDTRLKFGMSETVNTQDTCILVLNVEIDGEIISVGGLVDSVQEVLEIEDKDIKPAPSIGNKYKTEFINGVIRLNEEFIMLLDMDKMFSTDDASEILEATSTDTSEVGNEENTDDKLEDVSEDKVVEEK